MRTIGFILAVIILLTSCYKDIELYNEDDFKPDIVAYAIGINNKRLKVYVSKTALPERLDSTIWIDDADVRLYQNNNLIEQLKPTPFVNWYIPPVYLSDYRLETNSRYTLVIKTDLGEASGQIFIPQPITLKDAKIIQVRDFSITPYRELPDDTIYYYFIDAQLSVSFNDPDTANYYGLLVYTDSYSLTEDSTILHTFLPAAISVNIPNNINIVGEEGIIVSGEIPFVDSTFSNGLWLAEFFNDASFNGSSAEIKLDFFTSSCTLNPEEIKLYIVLLTVTEDVYRYFYTLSKYALDDENPLVEPRDVYTNVVGGIGLIGGLSYSQKEINLENE